MSWGEMLWRIISLIIGGNANHVGDDAENWVLIKMENVGFATTYDCGQSYLRKRN
jgi:hypothetical protein